MRARDTQKGRLYKAERTLPEFGSIAHSRGRIRQTRGDLGARVSVAEMQEFVDRVLARKRVVAQFGQRRIEATTNQGRGGAVAYGTRQIRVSEYYRTRLIILHEMAHCLTHARYGWGVAGHGWEFAETYLFLVREVMGVDVATRLAAAFKANRVRYRKPVKRVLTAEQKDTLRRRLAAMRAARTTPLPVAAEPKSLDIALARANQC